MEYLSVGDTALFYEPAVALVQGKDADAIISVQIFSITATFHFLAEFIIKLRSASEAFLPIFTRFSHHYIFRPVNLNQQAYSYYFPCEDWIMQIGHNTHGYGFCIHACAHHRLEVDIMKMASLSFYEEIDGVFCH